MLQQHLDVGEPGHPFAEHRVDRRLVQELLRRMAAPASVDHRFDERAPVGVDERDRTVRQHVALEPLG